MQYRKLLRALRAMRTEVSTRPRACCAEVLAGLEEAGERRAVRSLLERPAGGLRRAASRRPPPPACGGAIVLASRARRRLPLAG